MKIRIYTGVTVEPNNCLFDYLHPKFQINNFRKLVKEKLDFELYTNSDFIIRELNYFITEDILKIEDIDFFEDGFKVEGDIGGFECKSIDDIIEEQNIRCEESFYKKKYGEQT